MPPRPTPPITLPEYERLFRTIHAVLTNEKDDPSKAKLFFAIAGAYLLRRHHRLESVSPVAGMAAYNLSTLGKPPIIFGTTENEKFGSDADHFHCWIEADGWIIDLSAPLFDAMANVEGERPKIPPRMFQKPQLTEVSAVKLETPSAYIHLPNDRLTTTLMNTFTENPAYSDLVRICNQWYVRPPKKIAPSIRITDQSSKETEVLLSPVRLEGLW